MTRLLSLFSLLLLTSFCFASTIIVSDAAELKKANDKARPGDVIVLKNGQWKDVIIKLDCAGTATQPITFKAEMPGKVIISGHSQLKLGGSYIVVDGWLFTDGYAGDDAVIDFRINKNKLANHCRVTNTAIVDFNNPKRMDENYWISFSGKNNRVDHCSFRDKKNMGVLAAVILDDDRSRANFHSIDHNYFGRRPPLASNSGEIIRVGVSQHCEFNSNTQITDNLFEHCDGETEIVSIKSCSNVVRNNVFAQCQGGVVLRHGNFNTVENNLFLGDGKAGTAGVRIINKGQWVVNNLFYNCRGIDFRSPLSVMNGVPNSPAFRYVQVTDAVIANNTFYNCSSISFCEGSDTERSLPPSNVFFARNSFYNENDSVVYHAFDDISGLKFVSNDVSRQVQQSLPAGFTPSAFTRLAATRPLYVATKTSAALPDSLQQAAIQRLGHRLSDKTGFTDLALMKKLQANASTQTGAPWFAKKEPKAIVPVSVANCGNADAIQQQLAKKTPVVIRLTGTAYNLSSPLVINSTVKFTSSGRTPIRFSSAAQEAVFVINGNGHLMLEGLNIDGGGVQAAHFISNENSGSSSHFNLEVRNSNISNFDRDKGCSDLYFCNKYMVADSIIFRNNSFTNNKCNAIMMSDEKDDKGYYSAEKIDIIGNTFKGMQGTLLNVYRGGNDESTMGPALRFTNNKITGCNSSTPLLELTGVQSTHIRNNQFSNSNTGSALILYKDKVRAHHFLENNQLKQSGSLELDNFVTAKGNIINQ